MRKKVIIDKRALNELKELEKDVRVKFYHLVDVLGEKGHLLEPEGKKLGSELYEIRVRMKIAWRGLYAYISEDRIIVLRIFQKQSYHTPDREIKTALNRLKLYK